MAQHDVRKPGRYLLRYPVLQTIFPVRQNHNTQQKVWFVAVVVVVVVRGPWLICCYADLDAQKNPNPS